MPASYFCCRIIKRRGMGGRTGKQHNLGGEEEKTLFQFIYATFLSGTGILVYLFPLQLAYSITES
jgi:hypothetical protein